MNPVNSNELRRKNLETDCESIAKILAGQARDKLGVKSRWHGYPLIGLDLMDSASLSEAVTFELQKAQLSLANYVVYQTLCEVIQGLDITDLYNDDEFHNGPEVLAAAFARELTQVNVSFHIDRTRGLLFTMALDAKHLGDEEDEAGLEEGCEDQGDDVNAGDSEVAQDDSSSW